MDLSGSMQGAGGVGGLLSLNDGSATYYPTFDGNGNVSEYVDATGVVVAHYEYDAFGQVVASGSKKDDFTHQFSTKQLDSESGLHYYGYRYYDSSNGRWPGRDPIGEKGGVNLYGFVGNQPIWHIDVLGLKIRKPCPFDVTAGHLGEVDKREEQHDRSKDKCDSGRFYGASCGRTGVGSGLAWPTEGAKQSSLNGTHPNPAYNNAADRDDLTIGELVAQKIRQAEKDAPKECEDKKKCCSKVELKVSCIPSPSMKNASKNDPLARRACNYSNTYKCPNSKGKGGKWLKPLLDAKK